MADGGQHPQRPPTVSPPQESRRRLSHSLLLMGLGLICGVMWREVFELVVYLI